MTTEQTIQQVKELYKSGKRQEASDLAITVPLKELNYAPVIRTLAVAYYKQRQYKKSVAYFRRLIQLEPKNAGHFTNLGAALKSNGEPEKAVECYKKSLENDPHQAGVYSNMGNAYKALKKPEKGIEAFKKSIEIDPDFGQAYANLANILIDQERYQEARDWLEIIIERQPDYAKAYAQFARSLATQGHDEEASIFYVKALELDPEDDATLLNYSQNLKGQKRIDESIEYLEKCLAINPKSEFAHYHMGLFTLLQGKDLKRGFREYQWRWKVEGFPSPKRLFKNKHWTGQPLYDKSIVVWGEQGVGEEIMFSNMIQNILSEKPKKVYLEADHRLVPLFQRTWPELTVFKRQVKTPEKYLDPSIDFQSSSGSLSRGFRTSFRSFPKHKGYLKPDPKRVEEFQNRYKKIVPKDHLKVGIAWKSLNKTLGGPKTITLADWEGILSQEKTWFTKLQYGDCAQDLSDLKEKTGIDIYDDPTIDHKEDLDGLAAQISALDLVITTSNVTAHLAGALNVPALVLVPHVPLWHWFLDRKDSPWYPSLTMFRQYRPKDWMPVLNRVAEHLEGILRGDLPLVDEAHYKHEMPKLPKMGALDPNKRKRTQEATDKARIEKDQKEKTKQ